MRDKSVGAALVLTFLFGPFGVFYVSILWGIVWLYASVLVAVVTFGLGLFIIWPVSMMWTALMASNQHSKYQAWLAEPPRAIGF
jgi:hypothetical protein